MRQWIRVAQPLIGREDRNPPRLERSLDLVRSEHEHAIRQSRHDEVRVLVHRQHGHPVRGVIAEPEPSINVSNYVGKRPPARNNQQRNLTSRGCELGENRIKVLGVREQPTADSCDDSDAHGAIRNAWLSDVHDR
jgi:hypothetical protein